MLLKIKQNNKITVERLLFEVAMICIFSYGLLEHMSMPIPEFSSVKMPLLYMGGVCILMHIFPLLGVLRKKKYFYVMAVLAMFCVGLLLSMNYSKISISGANHQRNTVRLILYLIELFLLMIWGAESGCSKHIFNFLFFYVLILTIATDFLFFTRLIVFKPGRSEYYLVGTKFSVAYFHINLLTLWVIRNRERLYSVKKAKRIIMIGIPYVVFVSIVIDCITGFLGCFVMLILFSMMKTQKRNKLIMLKSPIVLLVSLAASVLFPFIAEQIFSLPIIENIVVNLLGRSKDLTGRMNIYTAFAGALDGHWLWGYGFGNANIVSSALFGYANTQNALLQWVIQIGIPGTGLLVFLMCIIFARLKDGSAVERAVPLVFLIYLYIVLGMVETTFSMSFLMWLALIFMISADTRQQNA